MKVTKCLKLFIWNFMGLKWKSMTLRRQTLNNMSYLRIATLQKIVWLEVLYIYKHVRMHLFIPVWEASKDHPCDTLGMYTCYSYS